MKNFIFATVSSVALTLSCAALANETRMPSEQEAKQTQMMELQPATQQQTMAPHHMHPVAHKAQSKMLETTPVAVPAVEHVYVAFPPVDQTGCATCVPSYYASKPECPYQSHEGYFWYPQAQADVVPGYKPYHHQGLYWYASRQHPHAVYAEKQSLVFVQPYPLSAPHQMDTVMHDIQDAPMKVKTEAAPVAKPAQEGAIYEQ